MATALRMPSLSQTMEMGRIVEWHVATGEQVDEGAQLVSIETDKAVVEVAAPVGGVLLKIVGQVDAEYEVGALLAWIGEEKESVPDEHDRESKDATQGQAVDATPVAVRVARRHGIDVAWLVGTGPGGRVTKEDVLRAVEQGAGAQSGVPAGGIGVHADIVPFTGLRRTTARRLEAHWARTPQVSEGAEADFSEIVAVRAAHKDSWHKHFGTVPTITDFVLKATAEALTEVPALNAALIDDTIHRYRDINLGLAIETPDGLVVPVIHGAAELDLMAIAAASKRLAARARDGSLIPQEIEGGTFTVTSLGGHDVDWFTPVVNPPQCAILAVGRARRKPAMVGNAIVPREMATLVLTFDHRLIDGAPAARFLGRLRSLIENPQILIPR